MPGDPLWAAFSSTFGFAEFAATVSDYHYPAKSLEPAERLGDQASACMSSELLLAELRELRSELAQLSNRVLLVEPQGQVSSVLGNPPVTVNYSVAGAGVLGVNGSPPGSPLPTSSAQTPVSTSAGRHRASECTEAERRQAAIEVGCFLRRALEEEHRGVVRVTTSSSSRASTCSARTCLGASTTLSRSSTASLLVKVDGECGKSVFVGLPTIWEAKVAVTAVGLNWPADE